MSDRVIVRNGFLLIARKDGRSLSRRQRRFSDAAAVERAIARWRTQGFNVWWLYGPPTGEQRPLLKQWRDHE